MTTAALAALLGCSAVLTYSVHGHAVSQEEVAEAGRVTAAAVGLEGGEGLQDVEGSVLQAVCGEVQTQVHGVCGSKEERGVSIALTQMYVSTCERKS